MKATAWAPSNIAFIKYWGKADETLRVPLNDSFSMNLSGAYTLTTVDFSNAYVRDEVMLQDGVFSAAEVSRVIRGLDRIRARAGIVDKARVVTKNTFPKGAGSAASASGFAALTVAGFAAAGVELSQKEQTIVARLGSGSACRSIPDGFVVWEKGADSASSYAHSIYPPEYWDLRDILVIVDSGMKKVSTSEGMETVATSPHLPARLSAIPTRMASMLDAFRVKDFERFGSILEEDCLDMHRVMQTQVPPLMYWNEITQRVMDAVSVWRTHGLSVYFTIDAGPNVHLICEGKNEKSVLREIQALEGIERTIVNTPAEGAHLVSSHLF